MSKIPSFQIGVLLLVCVYWAGSNVANRPFEDPSLNQLDTINELFYYFTTLFTYSFTQINTDENSKNVIGYVFNALLLTMLALNFGIILKD
jgi:hypothetical protein